MADSAYLFCQQQCDFGPRIMNSEAHERCGEWIAAKFRQYGMEVTLQRANLRGTPQPNPPTPKLCLRFAQTTVNATLGSRLGR